MKVKIIILIIAILVPLSLLNGQKNSKKFTISGLVTDKNNNPVAGVLMMVDDNSSNIITNNKGYYRIKVRPGSEIISAIVSNSFIVEEAINGRTTINFTIEGSIPAGVSKDSESSKNELVNVGYANIPKENLSTPGNRKNERSGSYATYSSIFEILKEVPGVIVSGTSVRIQGAASFNLSTEPLLVVDGMAVTSIDGIQPAMVESVSVLRGASASIYGVRGSNGVILITLKKTNATK